MDSITPFIAFGLLLSASPHWTEPVTQTSPGIPAVFVLPIPTVQTSVDEQMRALPPWLRPRDLDI